VQLAIDDLSKGVLGKRDELVVRRFALGRAESRGAFDARIT
jgi:hypothetical protein